MQALSRPQAQRARGKSCNSVMPDRKAVFSQLFFSACQVSRPPAPYRGKSGTPEPARPLSGEKRYKSESRCVLIKVHAGRCPDFTLYRAHPASYTVDAVPVKASGGVPFLDCVHSIAPCTPYVNRFFQKIFQPFFFRYNENARARRGSQNRRKQTKTGVLSAEKFFEKIRKSAQKRFFPSCYTPIF